LDPDVAKLIEDAIHSERKTFKDILNEAIRRGLASAPARSATPYKVKPHKARLIAGHDPQGFNRLADEMEDAALLGKAR
jgi:hypothetical protein